MSGSSLPADVTARLRFGPSATARRQRFYGGESVRCTASFTDPITNAPVDVAGVTFAFLYPTGIEAIAPEGFAVRLGVGSWACAIVPAIAGEWRVVVRCLVPTMAVDANAFDVALLPAGSQPPPTRIVTSDDGLFVLLTPDGAAITY